MIDIALLIVFGLVTWCVASEGVWGAAIVFLSTLFAGLLAMNYFEMVAIFMERFIGRNNPWSRLSDVVVLLILFGGLVMVFRFMFDHLFKGTAEVEDAVNSLGRWAIGAVTGYMTMAILLTALHTAPFPREFWGFTPERKNFLGMTAPDRQWLGFVQYVSEKSFRRGKYPRIFDGPQWTLPQHDVRVWPSFPIRYATRRQQYQEWAAAHAARQTREPTEPLEK